MLARLPSLALAGLLALAAAIPSPSSLGTDAAAAATDRLVFCHFMVSLMLLLFAYNSANCKG